MTKTAFLDFARKASEFAATATGHMGNLVCTQQYEGRPKVREPELRISYQEIAKEQNLLYGVEVPTTGKHMISGKTARHALHDFALVTYADGAWSPYVLVEFKEGQPSAKRSKSDDSVPIDGMEADDTEPKVDYQTLRKDLEKLFDEAPAIGRSMIHVVQTADRETISALETKYSDATNGALERSSDRTAVASMIDSPTEDGTWFLLLLLVVQEKSSDNNLVLYRGGWDGKAWTFTVDSKYVRK